MSKFGIFILAAVVCVALLASTVTYQVDQFNDIVLLKTVGRVSGKPMMGEDAGLKFKAPWPIQRVTVYPAKDFILEDAYDQVSTADKKPLLISVFCNWRIEDVVRLDQAVGGSGSTDIAEQALRGWLQAAKGAVIQQYNMSAIVNTDPSRMKLGEIEQKVMGDPQKSDGLAAKAMQYYGIRITRVGVKVLGLAEGASKKVIDSQIMERTQEARDFTGRGEAAAKAIVERANTAAKEIEAFASRRADLIRSQALADSKQYFTTFKENERLYMYLRSLRSLQEELGKNALLVLDASWFFQGPPTPGNIPLPDVAQKAISVSPAPDKGK